jgi:DNA-binding winged helix-turn-helix (wHTH) protein
LSAKDVWINGYLVNFNRGEIKGEPNTINVEPKVLAVLLQLYQANGEIVSQSTLMANVWTDVIVAPNTLQRCITLLRKLLGDDSKQQIVIKTHPKLGYSLNPQSLLVDKPNLPVNPLKNNALIFVMTTVVLIFAIVFYSKQNNSEGLPRFNQVKPLTTNGHSVQEFTVSHSGKFSILLRSNDYTQQLIYKELGSQRESVLVDKLQVKGNVAISEDDQKLAFGLQTKNENKKCIRLVTFDLINHKFKYLTPCQENFNHSPQWVDNQQLVYLSSDRERSSALYLYDIKQQTKKRLSQEYQNTAYLTYQATSQRLAWINRGGELTISTLDLKSQQLIELTRSILPLELKSANKLHWLNNEILVIPNKQSIYWYLGHELVKKQKLMTNSQVIDVGVLPHITPKKVIALFGQKDTSVRIRNIAIDNSPDYDVSASVFSESAGQYRPNSDDIALLSNKSGSRQLWLVSNQEDKQLTEVKETIEQFVWLNKEQIIYLSGDHLWQLTLGEQPILLATNFSPVRLYQANDEHLLLSINVKGKDQLVWFNIRNKQLDVLLNSEIFWAQRMNDNTFIYSGGAGKLQIYRDGKTGELSALPPLTIQSIYVWRDDNLYLQDKKLNVWRYDPIREEAEVIGKYDINSLFMTDFKPSTSTLVTDNFVAEQRDLVWLSEQ